VLAVDRVAVATGPKLFVDQIEAASGGAWVWHSWPPLAATSTPLKECQWQGPKNNPAQANKPAIIQE